MTYVKHKWKKIKLILQNEKEKLTIDLLQFTISKNNMLIPATYIGGIPTTKEVNFKCTAKGININIYEKKKKTRRWVRKWKK